MQYVKLELTGKYREIGSRTLRAGRTRQKHFRFDLFYTQIERIRENPAIRHVLVERQKDFSVPLFGGLEEIRAALQRLTESGKDVYYYAPEYDSADCVLSSACKRRILHPLGQVSFLGKAMPSLFFKKFLDSQEVDVTVIRRDRYKSSADNLRTEKYDKYARKQYQTLLDSAVASMREAVTDSSDKPGGFKAEALDDMIGGRIFTAPEALEAKMVDELRTVNDLINEWAKKKIKRRLIKKRRFWFGFAPRVAVLVFEGMIVDGEDRRNPLFGQAIGDRSMIRYIRLLRKNPRIKAVVFRINSGGGSATASENILQELAALHKKKPLVISMGPVAGSGGYWISTTGRRLFALPTTITGSIGVLTIFFNIARLLQKHGITTDCIRHGDSADLSSPYRQLTDKEHSTVDNIVGFLYQEFINRVASIRDMPPEKVHELAEGRLWLGKEAVKHNLVDEAGGLHDALAHIKDILKVKKIRLRFEPRQPFIMRLLDRQRMAAKVRTDEELTSLPSGRFEEAGFATPMEIARACLSVHGQMLFQDPFLSQFLSDFNDAAGS